MTPIITFLAVVCPIASASDEEYPYYNTIQDYSWHYPKGQARSDSYGYTQSALATHDSDEEKSLAHLGIAVSISVVAAVVSVTFSAMKIQSASSRQDQQTSNLREDLEEAEVRITAIEQNFTGFGFHFGDLQRTKTDMHQLQENLRSLKETIKWTLSEVKKNRDTINENCREVEDALDGSRLNVPALQDAQITRNTGEIDPDRQTNSASRESVEEALKEITDRMNEMFGKVKCRGMSGMFFANPTHNHVTSSWKTNNNGHFRPDIV